MARSRPPTRLVVAAGVLAALLPACRGDAGGSGEGTARWRRETLPAGAGSAVRVVDIAGTPDGLAVAGGSETAGGERRPAVWVRSGDGRWRRLDMDPVTEYGRLSEQFAVAAWGERVVTVGATTGGAHGNPRNATWYRDGDTMREVVAVFDQYGGADMVNLATAAAAPAGFVLSGNRINQNTRVGASTWWSAGGREFVLDDADPALMSGPGEQTAAVDVAGNSRGFVVLGGRFDLGHPAGDRAILWLSGDGRDWRRVAVRAPRSLSHVAIDGRGAVAVLGADGHGAARRIVAVGGQADRWQVRRQPAMGRSPSSEVVSLTAGHEGFYATLADRAGGRPSLWRSGDGLRWRRVPLPPGARAHPAVRVAAAGSTVVVVGSEGRGPVPAWSTEDGSGSGRRASRR